MEFVIGAAIVVVAILVLMYLRARSIAKRHAVTLSNITGIPPKQISQEMINGNQTPGEWAARHGLDPWTFAPVALLKDKITKAIAQEYPSETVLAVSEGQVESGSQPIAVAATDQAVHSATQLEHIRNEYSVINKVEVVPGPDGRRNLFLLIDFNFEVPLAAYLADADSVASAIDDQIASITLHTERVELTPEGGAVFRWRPMGAKYAWWIVYDPAVIGPDGRPTPEASAAQSAAIKRLNQYID